MSSTHAHSDLSEHEIWWRAHYNFFKEQGYTLRSRFSPDWVPSWTNTNKAPINCADGVRSPRYRLLDARRTHDGTRVSLKRIDVSRHPYEIEIGRYFCTSPLSQDPANHCVPIYDVLKVPNDDNERILVMPLLRDAGEPFFDTVGEVVDCVHQLLEGLQFMHQHHVAHRDCMQLNILMDGSMFLDAWHPNDEYMSEDLTHPARHRTRTQSPPRYYYIDFGISRKYDTSNTNPLEEPIFGGDKEVPEFKKDYNRPWNPFPTDVWYLGHAIQEMFLERYSGAEFLTSLVSDMMHEDPAQRPNMDEVVSRFKVLRQGLSAWKLRSRVAHVDERSLLDFVAHWVRRIQYIVRRINPDITRPISPLVVREDACPIPPPAVSEDAPPEVQPGSPERARPRFFNWLHRDTPAPSERPPSIIDVQLADDIPRYYSAAQKRASEKEAKAKEKGKARIAKKSKDAKNASTSSQPRPLSNITQ